jgi:hypothetical protein
MSLSSNKIYFSPTKDVRSNLKKCVNCIHFRNPLIGQDKPSPSLVDTHHNGICSLFGHVDPVTGNETYFKANVARTEHTLCSSEAIFYEDVDVKILSD